MERRIYTVSELTENIKALLETNYPFIWISGEISNFRIPASGHGYLTLKDSGAQIDAVVFRGQRRQLGFALEDGQKVTGMGRLTVYPPRGAYQIVLEYLEPAGLGALHAAFEQLKTRLENEGLFESSRKKPLPYLPQKIAVITSSTGAVLHDLVTVVRRRFPNMAMVVCPVPVQGHQSAEKIAQALERVNGLDAVDVVILARGGGSFEDLQPFNSEIVARAIFASQIPVVSGVGHETDVTIADFVADLRAPTPSAAAELTVPVKGELLRQQIRTIHALESAATRIIQRKQRDLVNLEARLSDPRRQLQTLRLRIDDAAQRLRTALGRQTSARREQLTWLGHRLDKTNPVRENQRRRERLAVLNGRLKTAIASTCRADAARLETLGAALAALNPRAILARGYSITQRHPDMAVVREAVTVAPGQTVEITLARGTVLATVMKAADES